jgi:hypothetical protein
MTDRALLTHDHTPARLVGHGPLPAPLARELLRTSPARAWVRRLFTSPATGELLALESRRRTFPTALRSFLVARDEVCRTPWCDAPIRHADHVVRAADDGPTSVDNGQGLCERCNHAKEAPDQAASRARAGPAGAITIRTPTGHTYTSTPPELPARPMSPVTPLERRFAELVGAA